MSQHDRGVNVAPAAGPAGGGGRGGGGGNHPNDIVQSIPVPADTIGCVQCSAGSAVVSVLALACGVLSVPLPS